MSREHCEIASGVVREKSRFRQLVKENNINPPFIYPKATKISNNDIRKQFPAMDIVKRCA